ncbi:MAG: hypothetical protein ABIJ65_03205 [Chloroflexota bacterium]
MKIKDHLLKFLLKYKEALVLLVVCILAYGVLVLWLGFYLDDWYIIWFYKSYGGLKFLEYFQNDRPLFAYVYMIFVPIFRDSRLAWQVFALLTHWLAAYTFWLVLQQVMRDRKQLTLAAAILFAVYPGFKFHWFSVMYSQMFLLYAVYFLSYLFMVRAVTEEKHRGLYLAAALVCQFVSIVPVETVYGLEFARPIVLFLLFRPEQFPARSRLKLAFIKWMPYLLILAGFTVFRVAFARSFGYPIRLLSEIGSSPIQTLTRILGGAVRSFFDSTIRVWVDLSAVFERNLLDKSSLMMLGLIAAGFIITFFVLYRLVQGIPAIRAAKTEKILVLLGLFLTFTGMIPFVMAGFEITLDFPNNRYLVSLIPGIALTVSGLIFYLVRTDRQRIFLVALLTSLSIGSQFLVARSFMIYWDQQKDFFSQLTWRAPALRENTLLVTEDVRFSDYFSATSLTAPLNMIYAPQNNTDQIPLLFYFFSGGQSTSIQTDQNEKPVNYSFRGFNFRGSTSSLITFVMPNNGCLRVLTGADSTDEFLNSPRFKQWHDAMQLSDLNAIIPEPQTPAALPTEIFGSTNIEQWCYYFEKADLERQLEKWDRVIELYSQANSKGFKPNNFQEWIPLLDAYMQTGQQAEACKITQQFVPDDPLLIEKYCPNP